MARIVFLAAGLLSLALGAVGIAVPVLPTTPFVLLASFCFCKSSSRLHRWLNAHPFFGPRIERFRKEGMTRKAKLSIYALVCVMLLPVFILTQSVGLRIFLAVLLGIKALVFWRIKTAP